MVFIKQENEGETPFIKREEGEGEEEETIQQDRTLDNDVAIDDDYDNVNVDDDDDDVIKMDIQHNESSSVPDNIVDQISEYVDLIKQIDQSKADVKILKQRANEIEDSIMTFMREDGRTGLRIPDYGRFSIVKKEKKRAINKAYVEEKITARFGHDNDEQIQELVNDVFDHRPVTEVQNKIKFLSMSSSSKSRH